MTLMGMNRIHAPACYAAHFMPVATTVALRGSQMESPQPLTVGKPRDILVKRSAF
jgi:hypothetical protein